MITTPLPDAAPPRRRCAALCVTRHRPRGLGRRLAHVFDILEDGLGGYCVGWKTERRRTDDENLRSPPSRHGGRSAGCTDGLRAACAPSQTDAVAALSGHPATPDSRRVAARGCRAMQHAQFMCAKVRNHRKCFTGSPPPGFGRAIAMQGCAGRAKRAGRQIDVPTRRVNPGDRCGRRGAAA